LRHLGQQLGVQSLDVGTLRSIYDANLKMLSGHQIFAQTEQPQAARSAAS